MTARVRDLMASPPVVASPETSLRDVATLLTAHDISGLPVVLDGRVVGVVSAADIVEKERGPDEEPHRHLWRGPHRERTRSARAETAGELMTSPPVVVDAWMSPYEAAWMMSSNDVARLPVVDRGRLVGVVTRTDLVRYFARPDDEIERDVREEVVDALPVRDISVSVEDGRVRLEGEVEREADLACLPHAVSRVPGVVAVDSRVRLRGAAAVGSAAGSA